MDFRNSKLLNYFNPENVQGAVLETNQLLHQILGDISLCKKIMKTTIIPLYFTMPGVHCIENLAVCLRECLQILNL